MKYFLIILLISISSFSCSLESVIKEVGNYHGAHWKTFLKNGSCSKNEVKNHLNTIIKTPNVLNEFVNAEQRALPYRNALKSFGSFVSSNESGVISDEDKEILKEHYKNLSKYSEDIIKGTEFTSRETLVSFFQTNTLESIKDTGSLSAVRIYGELMDDGDVPAFQVKQMSDFSSEVYYGRQEVSHTQGDLIYTQEHYPHLKNILKERYKDLDGNLVDQEYAGFGKKLLAYTQGSHKGVNLIKEDLLKSVAMRTYNKKVGNITPVVNKEKKNRSIASIENEKVEYKKSGEVLKGEQTSDEGSNWLYYLLALTGLFLLVVFMLKRK